MTAHWPPPDNSTMPQNDEMITNNCFDCGDGEPGIDDAGSRCANCELHYQECDICETHVDTRSVPVLECEACFKMVCDDCAVRCDYFNIDDKRIWCEACAEEPVEESCCSECDAHFDPKCSRAEYEAGDHDPTCSPKCFHAAGNNGCWMFVEPKTKQDMEHEGKVEDLCAECKDKFLDFIEGCATKA